MGYDLLFQQALSLHEQGRLDDAEAIYRRILETAPQNPDLHNLLGLIAQAKDLHSEAVNWFYQAVKLAPNHAPFYFNLAISLDADNKPIEAIEAYQDALRLQPDFKEACYNLGTTYLNQGQKTDAVRMFERALQTDPGYIMPKAELAFMQEDAGQLRAYADQYPQEAVFPYYLSRILLRQDKTEGALEAILEADRRQPDNEEIVELTARLQLQLDQRAQAHKTYRRLLELNPKSVNALINLANFATIEDNFELAESYYKKALDLSPHNLDGHLNYGNMLYRSQRLPEALEEYRSAVILGPDRPEISNNLGLIQKDIGEYEEALGLFFNAFFKDPLREEYAVNLSETLTLFHRQHPQEACQIARQWQEKAPDNIFANHLLAAFKGENCENNQVYSQKLFDHFADNYELVLKRIGYRTPRELRNLTGDVKGTLVDLGCGTGLVGVAYQAAGTRLIGVDISEKILEQARSKQLYQELINDDIVHFCQTRLAEYKPALITAADVFCYLGDLSTVISACAPFPLAFSIELNEQNDEDFYLSPCGRYQHKQDYILKLLKQAGYTNINQSPLSLRKENNQDVNGMIFTAGLQGGKND